MILGRISCVCAAAVAVHRAPPRRLHERWDLREGHVHVPTAVQHQDRRAELRVRCGQGQAPPCPLHHLLLVHPSAPPRVIVVVQRSVALLHGPVDDVRRGNAATAHPLFLSIDRPCLSYSQEGGVAALGCLPTSTPRDRSSLGSRVFAVSDSGYSTHARQSDRSATPHPLARTQSMKARRWPVDPKQFGTLTR